MKKLMLPVLIVLFLVMLLLAGCGGEPGGEILDKSIQTMEQVKSLKMTVDFTNEEGGQKQEESYEAVLVRSSENPDEYNMMLAVDVPGVEDEVYLVDGYQYLKIGGEWYKMPAEEQATLGLGQFEQLKDMSDEMNVTSESGDSWTLSFDLSAEFLEDAMSEGAEELETMGPEFDEMMQSFMESTKITGELEIAKSTYYLEIMKTAMSMDIEGLGSFSMDMTARFSDFDKDLEFNLPQDAKNARDLPEDMEIPDLPFNDPLSF